MSTKLQPNITFDEAGSIASPTSNSNLPTPSSSLNIKEDPQDIVNSRAAIEVTVQLKIEIQQLNNSYEQLKLWFAHLGFNTVDLISELGGYSLLIIHGDSLLLHVLTSIHDEDTIFDIHSQFLYILYTFEMYLKRIQECGGIYKVVFFNIFSNIFKLIGENAELCRNLLLLHLHMNGKPYHVFEDWYTSDYELFLNNWSPNCILLEDGSSLIKWKKSIRMFEEDEDEYFASVLFISFLSNCLHNKISVSLFYRMHQKGTKLLTYAVGTQFGFNEIETIGKQLTMECVMKQTVEDDGLLNIDILKVDDVDFKNIVEMNEMKKWTFTNRFIYEYLMADKTSIFNTNQEGLMITELITCCCCYTLLMDNIEDDEEELFRVNSCLTVWKILLLFQLFKRDVPLNSRCHPPSTIHNIEFFNTFVKAALLYFYSYSSEAIDELMEASTQDVEIHNILKRLICSSDVADYFDSNCFGNIFAAVISTASNNNWHVTSDMIGATQMSVNRLEYLWTNIAKQSTPFFPIDLSIFEEYVDVSDITIPTNNTPSSAPLMLCPLKSKFLVHVENTTLQKIGKAELFAGCSLTEAASPPEPPVELITHSVDAAEMEFQLFSETKIGSSISKSKLIGKTQEQVTKLTKRNDLKTKQRNASNLHVYAKSLSGADQLHFPIVPHENHKWLSKTQACTIVEEASPSSSSSKQSKGNNKSKGSVATQKIIEKAQETQKKKQLAMDTEVMKEMQKSVQTLLKCTVETYTSTLLNILVGYSRSVDLFGGFPAVFSRLKTDESRLKILLKTLGYAAQVLKTYEEWGDTSTESSIYKCRCVCFTFRFIYDLFTEFASILSGDDIQFIQTALISLGFKYSSTNLFKKWKQKQIEKMNEQSDSNGDGDAKDGKKKSKPSKSAKSKESASTSASPGDAFDRYYVTTAELLPLAIPAEEEFSFQMMYMAPYMDRCTFAKSDPRVKFKPDAWQRKILDVVDNYESAIVHAPTSSGKTFICYYVMDMVLQLPDPESVVVYVCPSKALMLQVRADIYARFSNKSYPPDCNIVLTESAEKLRRATNSFQSQIFVTVPYVLETILMSSTYSYWVKRLKYVILDEIHCIGEEGEAKSWEHLFQLIPSPIIAMSATIGNPIALTHWMRLCEASDKKLHYICHRERFSDLSKYWYTGKSIVPLHPISCILFRTIRLEGIPGDFYMSPQESLIFYNRLVKMLPEHDFLWLKPSFYFSGCTAITKPQCSIFSRTLIGEFVRLIKEGVITEEIFNRIVDELLNGEWDSGFTSMSDVKNAAATDVFSGEYNSNVTSKSDSIISKSESPEKQYLDAEQLVDTLRKLRSKELLPALLFNFSRLELHLMLNNVVKYLQDGQHNKYYGNPEIAYKTKQENKRRLARHKMKQKQKQIEEKMKSTSREQREMHGLDDDKGEDDVGDVDEIPPKDIAEEYDEEFNFANWKVSITYEEEVENQINRVSFIKRWSPQYKAIMVEGLRRGIAIHHNGLNYNYRSAVEILFRLGYLRVVIASGTMSLGIHMPCRCVMFIGDFLKLTPLMFRQMSGRSGRRSFDLVGHVIFWCIPFKRVRYLMSSQLPKLGGGFPISPSETLRVLSVWKRLHNEILEGEDRSRVERIAYMKGFINRLSRVFYAPLFSVSDKNVIPSTSELDKLRTRIATQIRFNLDFLMRRGFVGEDGSISAVANYVVYLFEEEPENIALAELICSGKIHSFLEAVPETERVNHLMFLLCHFLLREGVTRSLVVLNEIEAAKTSKNSTPFNPSAPLLQALPNDIEEIITEYNRNVIKNEICTLKLAFKNVQYTEADFSLPYTSVSFNQHPKASYFSVDQQTFAKAHLDMTPELSILSPFSALRGKPEEDFSSATRLADNIRMKAYSSCDSCPEIVLHNIKMESDGMERNAYLINEYGLNILLSGSIITLPWTHGLDVSSSYDKADKFLTVLKKLQHIMSLTFTERKTNVVATSIDALLEAFETRMEAVKA